MAQNIWFTSDTHFNHKNIIQYCNRPFSSIGEMNQALIDSWNSVVKDEDIIYHLGDFSFSDQDRFLNDLNGAELHFIIGNHDKRQLSAQWSSVNNLKEIKISGQNITLCHYAMRVWNKSHYGAWQLYGHSHSTLEDESWGKSMDVGVDAAAKLGLGYRPFHYDEIKQILDKRPIKVIDHHNSETNP